MWTKAHVCISILASHLQSVYLTQQISDWLSNTFSSLWLWKCVFYCAANPNSRGLPQWQESFYQRFGQLTIKIGYSVFFHASTSFQKSLTSAKQIWFQKVYSGFAHRPKKALEAPFRKAIYCLPCICSVWKRNWSRPSLRKYSDGNKKSSMLQNGSCTCSLPECMTRRCLPLTLRCYLHSFVTFYSHQVFPILPFQQQLFERTAQLLSALLICILLATLNELLNSQL